VTRAVPKAQIRLFRSLRRQPLDDPAAVFSAVADLSLPAALVRDCTPDYTRMF